MATTWQATGAFSRVGTTAVRHRARVELSTYSSTEMRSSCRRTSLTIGAWSQHHHICAAALSGCAFRTPPLLDTLQPVGQDETALKLCVAALSRRCVRTRAATIRDTP